MIANNNKDDTAADTWYKGGSKPVMMVHNSLQSIITPIKTSIVQKLILCAIKI
jgi:hypothetical protein